MYQVRGLSLHDLRFRGQRIVYELATQEMYVSYNGYGGAFHRWQMSAPLRTHTTCFWSHDSHPWKSANCRSWEYILL